MLVFRGPGWGLGSVTLMSLPILGSSSRRGRKPSKMFEDEARYSLLILLVGLPVLRRIWTSGPLGVLDSKFCLSFDNSGKEPWTNISKDISQLQGAHSPKEFGKEKHCRPRISSLQPQFCKTLNYLTSMQQQPAHHLQFTWLKESATSPALLISSLLPGYAKNELSTCY